MRRSLAVVLGFLSSMALAQQPVQLTTHQLKPHIYWVEGGGGNSTVIVGTGGVVVIDAKTTEAGGKALLAEIAKITSKPVETVILTHSDGDHANGLAAFPKGIRVISTPGTERELKAAYEAKVPNAIGPDHWPRIEDFRTRERIRVEGVALELFHIAPAHTSGDLVIDLTGEKIIATGDIIATSNPYPRIHDEKGGTSAGWLATAKEIEGLGAAEVLIPGHGNPINRAELEKRIADATARRDEVRRLEKEGKTLEQVKAAVGDHDKLNYKSWTEICYEEAKAGK